MYVIADSSSTRTEWVLVDQNVVVSQATTQGLNPYFLSRREISHCIRLELPDEFFRRRWDKIYFYGAGCATKEKNKVMELSLVAQFRTPVEIHSDLLGAARGLFVREKGLACIMGTGSNSCTYNGEKITRNIRSGGFILGDEGSGAYIGKVFLSDCLKGLAPEQLTYDFFKEYEVTPDELMDEVYSTPTANRTLARIAVFLMKNQDNEYVQEIVKTGFRSFFERTILQYHDYESLPLGFVGRTAENYHQLLKEVAEEFKLKISKISNHSIPGLVEFHSSFN